MAEPPAAGAASGHLDAAEPATRDVAASPVHPDPEPVIVAHGLRREFGEEVALDHLELTVPRGSIYGFVGPSGSGKTTTIRLLTGIDKPTEGTVEVLGHAADSFDRRLRRRIGYLPQESVQFPNLSVKENLTFAASLYGLPLRNRQIIDDVLERTELTGHEKKPVRSLSGGMKRRLALGASLLHEPEVLFLDEPTAGIDPVLRRKLWDWFEALRDAGVTLFVTTQYVGEAAYCDRVGVLAHGRLIAEDSPQGLRRQALGGDVLELTPSLPFDEPTTRTLQDLDGVREVRRPGRGARLRIVVDAADQRLPQIQDWCTANDLKVDSLREDHVPFDDVFAALMQQEPETAARGEQVEA
jgi:ABC-2 type transport system ATP-binding protein